MLMSANSGVQMKPALNALDFSGFRFSPPPVVMNADRLAPL